MRAVLRILAAGAIARVFAAANRLRHGDRCGADPDAAVDTQGRIRKRPPDNPRRLSARAPRDPGRG